jgi:hypothetical protein
MSRSVVLSIGLALASVAAAARNTDKAEAELAALATKVPTFRVVPLPDQGDLALRPDQSLTVEHLRGVQLQDDEPALGELAKPYDPRMTDAYPPGEAPYVAKGIRPFRFRYFNCEFNYGGWHNFGMTDYAATHGFNILFPYTRKLDEGKHLPPGTKWLGWGGFINWHTWFGEHGLPDGRYDLLADMDLVAIHLKEGKFKRPDPPTNLKEAGDFLMIDMEHPVLSPEKLRTQDWYPKDADEAARKTFETNYYLGYAKTYTSAVEAARKQGWRNISIYGWQPYGRTWGGLEKPEVDPGGNHAWNTFGKRIYDTVDIINNSVYCFYWSPQNVAYVLSNIDSNMALVDSMPVRKPVRPYFWTLLHGGGGGWRWWKGQPVASEEERAMTAMAFFTGIDGFDTWNWSGTGNHHQSPVLVGKDKDYFASGADVMLRDGFDLAPEGGGKPEAFRRYDVLHVTAADKDTGMVRFQKILKNTKGYGIDDRHPTFSMPMGDLRPHLRIKSEPVAAMIEGMALVKPFEYILRHGQVKIDVPSREQWKDVLPISRRVQLGSIHLVITYDPKVVYGDAPRRIVLPDFAGRKGLTVTLPADSQTRIFVFSEQ